MNRRAFLAACGGAAAVWSAKPAHATTVFPIQYRQQPAYSSLLAHIAPGSDEFAGEAVAMRITAALKQAIASGRLPVSANAQAVSLVPAKYEPADGGDCASAVFAKGPSVDAQQAWQNWRKSLGEVLEARFFPLPEQVVRYEVKSRNIGRLEYRVGTWRQTWVDGKLTSLTPLSETLAHAAQPWFADVTGSALAGAPEARTQFQHGIPYWRGRLDPACGIDLYGSNGIAVGDIDGDGLDEIYVCQPGGLPNRLLKNDGHGRLTDITAQAGVDLLDDTASALFLDLRNSGAQDLVVLRSAGPLLYTNDGHGRFTLVRDAFQFAQPPTGGFTGMAAADFDRDGFLDLYLCCYVYFQSEAQYRYPVPYHDARNGPPNFLFRNRLKDSSGFEDVTASAGLNENNDRFSFAPAWCDHDGNGWPDLYVANDFGKNNFYRNRGGHFQDVAAEAGVEDLGPGMSAAWFDYDGDGHPDLYVANMWSDAGQRVTADPQFRPARGALKDAYARHTKGNSLYRNLGTGAFEETDWREGVSMGRWAWSADAHDFDNDGHPDIFVTCGMLTNNSEEDDLMSFFWRQVVARTPVTAAPKLDYEDGWNGINQLVREDYSWSGREPNVVYARRGDRYFDVSGISGLDFAADSRAFAAVDLDGDGYLDLVVKSRLGAQVRVLQNQTAAGGRVVLSLRGTKSNRDAIGAKVELDGQTKWISAGSSYLSQHTKNLHFRLTNKGSYARITWPSGLVEPCGPLEPGNRYFVTEGGHGFTSTWLSSPQPQQATPDSGENRAALHTTWLWEPVPLPEQHAGPALLLLRGPESIAPPAGVPCRVVSLTDNPERATAYALFRRYLFDYRANLETPFWLLIDGEGHARKVYAHAPTAAEAKADIASLGAVPDRRALPFAGHYHLTPKRDYYKLGAAFLGAGYGEHALPYLQEALRRSPDNPRTLLAIGRVQFQANRLADARAVLRQATTLDPSLLEAWNELGGVEAAAGDPRTALVCYDRALALGPHVTHVLFNAAHAQEAVGHPGEAEALYRRLLDLQPDHTDGLNSLGQLLAKQGHYPEARELFQRALTAKRDDALAINNLGVLYSQMGQLNDAIAAFRYGIKVAPQDDTLYMNLARLYARTNEFSKAHTVLEELLAQQPQHAGARRALLELEQAR